MREVTFVSRRPRASCWCGVGSLQIASAMIAIALAVATSTPASADTIPYETRNTYGEVGILDMPSARNAPDGTLSLVFGDMAGIQHFNFSAQLLPWMEASFRYSRTPKLLFGESEYDRSFGMKIRLSEEGPTWPEISFGVRDLLGTGLYSGEYFVATKRVQDFDLTLGLGWGRFSQRAAFKNPLAMIFPSFGTRSNDFGQGGVPSFGQYFHSRSVGLFGGIIWHTPVENLDFLVEYSSDKYAAEVSTNTLTVHSPFNVGLSYRLLDVATISGGWFYGSNYGVTLSMSTDAAAPVSPQKLGPEIPSPVVRPAKQQVDALSLLMARNRPIRGAVGVLPWVQLPTPRQDPDSLALASALMSETDGVHDVDVMGNTVLIDARLTQLASRQCDRYAAIVSELASSVKTVAISDSSSPSGKVAICAVAHQARFLAANDTSAAASSEAPIAAVPDADPQAISRKIRDDIGAQNLQVEALSVEPEMIWLYFSNQRYASEAEAVGRIARVLMADAPPSAEIFHIVSVRIGSDLHDFEVVRSALERATLAYGTTAELGEAVSIHSAPLSNPVLERGEADSYPRFNWSIGPGLREGLFDPHRPFQVQVLAAVDASVDLTPNITLEGRAEANIFNTYDLSRGSDSVLPHVRSDLVQYYRHGINGIATLDARYQARVSRDIYFEVKAGYLEGMFAGGGAQLLWRPQGSRFAFGADVYQVWQRNFDRLFGLQNYHVLTGHASVYYDSPWFGLNFAVHAGRYLAGDYGATFEATRRFSTGVEIGAFATFTNVPFARFGEGSFDKGIIIHIPLEWGLPLYTQTSYDLLVRSLTRDGGQRLDADDSLYTDTRPTSYAEVLGHVDEIVAP